MDGLDDPFAISVSVYFGVCIVVLRSDVISTILNVGRVHLKLVNQHCNLV